MPELLISLLTFALVSTASPGGATTLATASGVQFGLARSVPLLAGIAVGLGSLIGVVGGGLGTIILAFPQVQMVLKLVGSVYLLWLAWGIARLGAPNSASQEASSPSGFAKGVLLLWLNPKAWTMAVSAAAAYADLSDNPMLLALLLGSVFGMAAIASLTLWCIGGQWLSLTLKSERQW